MRRVLRYIPPSSPLLSCRYAIKRRALTTTPLTRWMDDTLQQDTTATKQQQQTSGLLSQFYRGLATHNIDQLWPLYSHLYQNHMHTRLTRNNYRQLIQVTARSPKTQRNLHRLLAVMEDMQQLGIPLRLSDYNIVMCWIGGATVPQTRPRHVTDALEWLATLEKQDSMEPSVVTYNTLIHVASQANDLLTAQRLYHAMLAKGIEADAYTYTTLLHSMATMGDVQGVHDMVTRLDRKGSGHLLQRTVTWNILLDCYYSSNHTKADDMFQSMVHALDHHNSTTPKADQITFEIHISHLIRLQQRTNAIHLLDTLAERHHIRPTLTMYNKIFASFMNTSDHLTQLKQVYASFQQQQQLQPNSETLYTLINALLDHHDTTFALETFVHLCQEKKLTPAQDLLDRLADVIPSID